MIKNRPTMLMILDGYRNREKSHGNAIAAAKNLISCAFAKIPVHHPWKRAVKIRPDFLTGKSATPRLDTQYRVRKRCATGPSSHQ